MSTEILKNYQLEVAHAMKCAAEDYIEKNPPEAVAEQLTKVLDESRDQIIRTLLGFKVDNWGRMEWAVDHCNGRAGESAVGDYLRRVQADKIHEWLETADLGELDEGMVKNMRKEFNSIYTGRLQRLVTSHANKLAQEHFDELMKQDALGDLAQIDELLQGESS